MAKKNIPDVNKYISKHKKRSVRQRVLVAVAALVVFCTTYAMILPAITMEGKLTCELNEHTHKLGCYSTEKKLVCGLEETEGHMHEENCYDNSGNLICTLQAVEPHTHTDECYEEKTILNCDKVVHTHSSSCYETTQQATAESTVNTEDSSENTSESVSEKSSEVLTKDKADTKLDSKAKNNVVNSGARDFATYIEGKGGTVTYKIVDGNNQVVDINKASGEGYRFVLEIDAPDGIEHDLYEYSYPSQIQAMEADKHGDIKAGDSADSEVVGTYDVDGTNCVITLNFDEKINDYQNFKGNLHFAVRFDIKDENEEPVDSKIEKTGGFVEEDGLFHFKIEATIPSYSGTGKFHEWYITDYSSIDGSWNQDLGKADIKITYGNKTYDLPEISEATADDDIAYLSMAGTNRLYLVNRCECTGKGNCEHWDNVNNKCDGLSYCGEEYSQYTDWCVCWNLMKNSTLTIEYKNGKNIFDGSDLLKDNAGYTYINSASLIDIHNRKNNRVSNVNVPIPILIEKTGTSFVDSCKDFIGDYSIVVNESMIDFSEIDNDGNGTPDTEIVVEDVMTDLAYVPGSIKIVTTDENSDENTLVYGTDYKIDYIPGEQIDNNGDGVYESVNNVMNITLYKLGKYQYTITYQGQIIAKVAEGEPYDGQNDPAENTATLKIYKEPSDDAESTYTFGEGWSYIKRSVNIEKTEFGNENIKLDGAVYGLYSEDGYEMARGTTANGGLYLFKTDVRQGVTFQSNKLYYIKELTAPRGYSLDTAKHWFYFAENEIGEFQEAHPGISFYQVPSDGGYAAEMKLTDEKGMELPETGSYGTVIYTIAGVILSCGAAYVLYKKFLRWKEGT
ncbi:MAG: Ig-like domain-containing protein [Acutalibacteraceae bacterium]|nr:Ig-like domain-containing protein [Acutalibacteraceae bacterium]